MDVIHYCGWSTIVRSLYLMKNTSQRNSIVHDCFQLDSSSLSKECSSVTTRPSIANCLLRSTRCEQNLLHRIALCLGALLNGESHYTSVTTAMSRHLKLANPLRLHLKIAVKNNLIYLSFCFCPESPPSSSSYWGRILALQPTAAETDSRDFLPDSGA